MAAHILLPLLLLTAASPAAFAAFDVTQMLADKSQYGAFSKLLTQTKVGEEANRLKSASLLVLPDKAVKPIASLPADKQRLALANHVLLKYFDPIQLGEIKGHTAMLPTLLSNSDKRLGFVNYTKAEDGQMYFGATGASSVSKLVKVVAARPYAISIMEVSEAILPPEIWGSGGLGGTVGGRRPKGGKGKLKPKSVDEATAKSAPTPSTAVPK
ncbi:fasciclin-like arabinogalactan protein 3 [Oryza brachyantha]|uniref:FAS1 domain-containing protein n=1 Tax=Oryza brachyantha TaxID=4533 RepID=J3LCL4_ORYBR|nr:fasciclin-like arabinogalactan protein 3 [Oryza brachyantha]